MKVQYCFLPCLKGLAEKTVTLSGGNEKLTGSASTLSSNSGDRMQHHGNFEQSPQIYQGKDRQPRSLSDNKDAGI
jgi:hypothetical protein